MHSSPRDTGAIIARAPVLGDAFKEVGWSTGLISTKLYRGYADNWEHSYVRLVIGVDDSALPDLQGS